MLLVFAVCLVAEETSFGLTESATDVTAEASRRWSLASPVQLCEELK